MARSQRGSHKPPRWCWTRTGLKEGLLARQPRSRDRALGHYVAQPWGPVMERLSTGRPEAWGPRGSCQPQESRGLGWDQPMEEAAGRPGKLPEGGHARRVLGLLTGPPPPGQGVSLPLAAPQAWAAEFPRSVNCVLQIKIATSMPLKIALLTQAAQNSVGTSPLAGGPAPRASHWLWRKHGRNSGGRCPAAGGRPQEPCALPLVTRRGPLRVPGPGAPPGGAELLTAPLAPHSLAVPPQMAFPSLPSAQGAVPGLHFHVKGNVNMQVHACARTQSYSPVRMLLAAGTEPTRNGFKCNVSRARKFPSVPWLVV